jgi:ParB family chromosome partitioning protein
MSKTNNTPTQEISLKDISPSPFNYRWAGKPVDEKSLEELAASIKIHEVIQAVTVRPLLNGKYELVIGERRLRASKIAGKKTIPASIRELTNEQVKEIQLIENLQRENPHPMADALGIQQLLSIKDKKITVEEVANRIGKSTAYVYQRLKLCDLHENFREMFLANAINISQALKVARLDSASQLDFFESYCSNWNEENWMIHNFNARIENYQLDLDDAPFNIKDAKLDKKAGACTKCPNNTAVTTSLFPEDSKEARCTNRTCYENKCRLFVLLNLAVVIKENPDLPIAVRDETILTTFFSANDELIKGKTILIEDVDFPYYAEMDDKPDRKSFTDNEDEDENETEFQQALSEYETELQRMEDETNAGNYRKAILITERESGKIVYLEPIREADDSNHAQTSNRIEFKAKDYQEAVKAKTLTLEMVASEKERLRIREDRSKELDEIKLQENFYNALEANESAQSVDFPAGINDKAVGIFLMYDSLNYHWRNRFTSIILDRIKSKQEEDSKLIQFFFTATDNEISVLARMAMLNKAEAKLPDTHAGQMLRVMVEGTYGMDASELVNIQRTVTKERETKLNEKLFLLDKQAEKL